MSIIVKHKVQCFRNQKLYEWYESLSNQHDKEIAIATVDYIKINYPEFRDVLLGELMWVEEE